jgi:hypothetical protein
VAVGALLLMLPEILVPRVSQAQPHRAPPKERIAEGRAVAPCEVAYSGVPTNQLACVQCSCKMCDKDESSKIWKV